MIAYLIAFFTWRILACIFAVLLGLTFIAWCNCQSRIMELQAVNEALRNELAAGPVPRMDRPAFYDRVEQERQARITAGYLAEGALE